LPFALDVEIDLQATNASLINAVDRLLVLLWNEYGSKPIIYTGRWWWNYNMTPAELWMSEYDFWCAQYPYAAGRVDLTWGALSSILPTGWTQPVTGGKTPVIWQFSGDKFFFPGVGGALDLNLFNGNEAAFRVWAKAAPLEPDWEHSVDPFLRTLGYTGRAP
jgi:GH25 family lysozyme M1 (1,4-beta-N-acetylmuramidase)